MVPPLVDTSHPPPVKGKPFKSYPEAYKVADVLETFFEYTLPAEGVAYPASIDAFPQILPRKFVPRSLPVKVTVIAEEPESPEK